LELVAGSGRPGHVLERDRGDLLNAPGPGPGGATVYPPTIAEGPTDVADGPGITDVISEQA
jgi:hypothetical protein